MNDIAKRARELIYELSNNGFKDFPVPEARVSCEGMWSKHYACVDHLYVDTPDHEYFDHSELDYDFRSMLEEWFTFDDEKTTFARPSHDDKSFDSSKGLIVVRYLKSCDELEVYRLIDGKVPGGDDAS